MDKYVLPTTYSQSLYNNIIYEYSDSISYPQKSMLIICNYQQYDTFLTQLGDIYIIN